MSPLTESPCAADASGGAAQFGEVASAPGAQMLHETIDATVVSTAHAFADPAAAELFIGHVSTLDATSASAG